MLFFVLIVEALMRTTLSIDDDLLKTAQVYSGIKEKSALVRADLESLVQREAARRLILLRGSAPELVAPPRRRHEPASYSLVPPSGSTT
jgi:Arc/MetJ family transcription regulator